MSIYIIKLDGNDLKVNYLQGAKIKMKEKKIHSSILFVL